jgi:hypothetical protein
VNRFVGAQILSHPITDFGTLRILGFPLELQLDDFDWLLEDAERRPAVNERQVAASAALGLWRQGGSRPDQLARLAVVGAAGPEVAESIEAWTRPRPRSEGELALEREMRRNERRSTVEWAKREQSWREFADRLRADPGQLRSLKPPSDKGVDARLYHLWHLLNAVGSNRSRYAIDDLTPLEPMFGPEVVSALHDAFVAYWRHWAPTLRSERPDDERNTINTLDCIGIVGVTLEAARHPGWATTLSHEEAVLAAIYATLELNGFPNWFVSLAEAQPNAVREVLLRAVAPELKAGDAPKWCEMLEDVSQADVAISSLLANQLFDYLRQNEALPTGVLAPMLRILKGGYEDRAGLAQLLYERFDRATVVEEEALYLAALFELNPTHAITALDAKLALLPAEGQTLLVQSILPTLFGARWANRNVRPGDLPFETLERLVAIVFRTIRVEADTDRPAGQVDSPDARDDAQDARGALFKTLIDTPGLATFDAIHRLQGTPDFPIRRERMTGFARKRAESDSEAEAWSSADVYAFETEFLRTPRNPFDLQRLALRRLADLQHDLLNADYAQGATVSRLPNEVDVQNWMADTLRRDQGRSYSIEREPHVVEEKEPDIRFRAKASDANVPMEIKVAESWSLNDLEHALKVQLVGQYLRDRHNRHGILLLVHKEARARGWVTATGEFLTFEQVVGHLRALARSIAAESPDAPQVEIAVINVSSVTTTANRPQAGD